MRIASVERGIDANGFKDVPAGNGAHVRVFGDGTFAAKDSHGLIIYHPTRCAAVDAALKDKDPGTFKLVAVPLPKK